MEMSLFQQPIMDRIAGRFLLQVFNFYSYKYIPYGIIEIDRLYLLYSRAKYLQMAMVSGIMSPLSIWRQGRYWQGKSERWKGVIGYLVVYDLARKESDLYSSSQRFQFSCIFQFFHSKSHF